MRMRGTFEAPMGPLFISPVPNMFHSEVLYHLARTPGLGTLEAVANAVAAIDRLSGGLPPGTSTPTLQPRAGRAVPSTAARALHEVAILKLTGLSQGGCGSALESDLAERTVPVARTRKEGRLLDGMGVGWDGEPGLARRRSISIGGLARLSISEVAGLLERGRLGAFQLHTVDGLRREQHLRESGRSAEISRDGVGDLGRAGLDRSRSGGLGDRP